MCVVGGSSPLPPALLPHHLTAALTSQILSVAFGWKSEAASVNSMVCRKFSPPKHFLQWGLLAGVIADVLFISFL